MASSYRVWRVKDFDRIRGQFGTIGMGKIVQQAKDAPIQQKIVNCECVTIRRGRKHDYYRFAHYDSKLYQQQSMEYKAGTRRSKPTGRRWCQIERCDDISENEWHKMFVNAPYDNGFHVAMFQWILITLDVTKRVIGSASGQEIKFDRMYKQVSGQIKSCYDVILSKYRIPQNEMLFLRETRDKITEVLAENMPTDIEHINSETIRRYVRQMLDIQRVAIMSYGALTTYINDYYMRHYKYKEDFGDDISDLELITKIFNRISSKRRGQYWRLRVRKLDERLEPQTKEDAEAFNFAGIQCQNCSSWRVDEIHESIAKKSWKCFRCGHVMHQKQHTIV